MKRYLTPAWVFTAIVLAIPLLYSFTRLGSEAFRDSALANLFSTILGIIIGVPIAIELSRQQEAERERRSQSERATREKLRAAALFHRLREELIDNGHTLTRLRSAIGESPRSRDDHWRWILAVTEDIRLEAYTDFTTHAPQPPFPWDLDDSLRLAFSMLAAVGRRAREAAAAYAFFAGSQPEAGAADPHLQYVANLATEANRRVKEAVAVCDRHGRHYPRPQPEH
jgi:hypothetical protein